MYGNRIIKARAIADRFTGMKTYAAAYRRKRVFKKYGLYRILVSPLIRKHFNTGNVLTGRAGRAARCCFLMVFWTYKPPCSCFIYFGGDV